MKKKITRQSLDALSNELPALSELEQAGVVGGGSGTEVDPYTREEYERMLASGTWLGGFVDAGYSYWGATDSSSVQGDRGVVYVDGQPKYSYSDFEKMAIVGEWKGGLVRMRDNSVRYLAPDAKDDDGLINITGNDNIDRMFTGGYIAGYEAAKTPGKLDDVTTLASGVLSMMISGSEMASKHESDWAMYYHGLGKFYGLGDGKKGK